MLLIIRIKIKIIFDLFSFPGISGCEEKACDFNEQICIKVKRKKVKPYFETDSFFTMYSYFVYAGLLASFPCKLNTFRNRVKNVVTSKEIGVGIECK